MKKKLPQNHDTIDFSYIDIQVDSVLSHFKMFLIELNDILRSRRIIIDSSYTRTAVIYDAILELARKVEQEMIRIKKAPESEKEVTYGKIIKRNEANLAFNLIMQDFVDRHNHLPERVKGDIDDTVGKLRNFLKHVLRDFISYSMNMVGSDAKKLYVQIFYTGLKSEIKRTRELLDFIIRIQQKFLATNLTPGVFKRIEDVFRREKLIESNQWDRIKDVLIDIDGFFQVMCMEKKHLMRYSDFFLFEKKVERFTELTNQLITKHDELGDQEYVYAISDYKELLSCSQQFEHLLLDLENFLEFVTYEIQKRECLSYKKYFLEEATLRGDLKQKPFLSGP